MSADLLWLLTRDNSSFLVKRDSGRVQFSRDALNLTNKNNFRDSGLVNDRAVGLTPTDKGAVLTVKSKTNSNARRPAKLLNKTTLTRDFRRVARSIKSQTSGQYYRGDLAAAALARWTKIHASQRAGAGKAQKAGRQSRKSK